jgi:cell division septal protein FtsQ
MTRSKHFLLLATIALIFFITLSSVAFFHPKLNLTSIEFKNNNFISEEELTESCSNYIEKNILYMWLTKTIQKTIHTNFPQIKSIQTKIYWPNKICFQIYEKQPFVSFFTEKKTILISKDGTILNNAAENYDIPNLNELIIFRGIPKTLFQKNTIAKPLLKKTIIINSTIKQYFPKSTFQIEFLRIDLNTQEYSQDKILLLSNDTLPIKLGTMENLPKKIKSLKDFLANYTPPAKKNLAYIDLRINNKVIVSYETR